MESERASTAVEARVRALVVSDLPEVIRIDAAHSGQAKPAYWQAAFERFCGAGASRATVGLAAEGDGGLDGYLFGEVREVEFGSEACGWVFAVGVDERALRRGTASALLERARARFAELGVAKVRTMVARNDVPVLSFFRASGFVGGPYVQLELPLQEAQP
ncbi:MAG: GNAT family N-acetyltransferase [Planctomycetota bacterium]|nr:GNAT family N-acetyltransferase [Planctomycetota bacterium]